MLRALWNKFMINVGINQASAVLRANYSVFQTSAEARELMESAMKEVINIARMMNINLSEDDIRAFEPFLMGLGPNGKTSMLQDVEAGRETEVEMLAGQVIKLGKRCGIPTPINGMLYEKIKKIEASGEDFLTT
jgi:2-dehydropantoate 2-reductase